MPDSSELAVVSYYLLYTTDLQARTQDFWEGVMALFRMDLLKEQDLAVCSGPSQLTSCHTPAADKIKWEWLVIFYLIDVFHVVYKIICAPLPILLVLHLKT